MSCIVSADLPTPPPPTTTSLYSRRKFDFDMLRVACWEETVGSGSVWEEIKARCKVEGHGGVGVKVSELAIASGKGYRSVYSNAERGSLETEWSWRFGGESESTGTSKHNTVSYARSFIHSFLRIPIRIRMPNSQSHSQIQRPAQISI